MHIREEDYRDYLEVSRLVKAAFETVDDCDGDEAEYLAELRKQKTFIPELSFVAEEESKIVGQIVLTKTWIQTETGNEMALLLSPLSVHPDYFRQGIAIKLVEHALYRAKQLGYSVVFLCGNPMIYSKMGFRPSYEKKIYHIHDKNKDAKWCMFRELIEGALDHTEGFLDIV